MIKWLGENGGELVGTKKYLCVQKERIFVYKLDSFVGFIGDEQLHAQECYGPKFLLMELSYTSLLYLEFNFDMLFFNN
jgi:hypothetical protein